MSSLPETLKRAFGAYDNRNFSEAEHLCRRILAINGKLLDALRLLALTQSELGKNNEALDSYARLLVIRPNDADALNNRGNALQELGRFDEALGSYERALAVRPDFAEAHNNCGVTFQGLGRFDEALESVQRALAIRPDYAEAHNNRGNTLHELQRLDEALESFQRALAIRPDYAEAHNNRGNTLHELKRFGEALESFQRALAIRPDYAEAHNNRGNAFQGLGRFDEALHSYRRALEIKPDYAEAFNNRGNALHELLCLDDALESYDRALAIKPDYASCHLNRAFLLLQTGRFAEGWREYEWRLKTDSQTARPQSGPEWTGGEVGARRLLFYSEQGLGDTIQFSRFACSVAASGKEVSLEVQPPLGGMLGSLKGVNVIRNGATLPEHDAQLPLMSLPHVLGVTPETMSGDLPYLFAEPARAAAWSERLPAGQFRVGIVWQGKSTADIDIGRSVPLRAFAPLCHIPGVKLISLQKNHGLEQLAHLPPGMSVETLGAEFDAGPDAFMDCAAVMMNLDLVICCDTAAAHLAGALGRPVWIVLKHVPDWRWMIDREDTPWYPTARLFRQARRGDWDEVFLRIASELARAAAAKTNPQDLLPRQRADSLDSIQAVPLGTALVPVSFGELVDKITILEIKSERIEDFSKLANVRTELDLLTTALSRFCAVPARAGELKAELQQINEALWEIEDQIRDCERRNDFGARFVDLARRVYLTNDRRSAVKRQLNELAGSVIVEEKSYAEHTGTAPRV